MAVPLELLHLSDIHFAADGAPVGGRDPASRLAVVLEAVSAGTRRLDALVLTGDLTDDGTRGATADLAATLLPLGLPTLAVPGNHDDSEIVREVFGPDVLELGGWRLIGVDTSRPGDIHGTADVAAVVSRLDGHDESFTLLAQHHPPVSPSTHPWFDLIGAAELAQAVAERPHVRAFLTGHLHHPFTDQAAGVEVLGAPSTLIAFHHNGPDIVVGGSPQTGARLCTLHPDGTLTSRYLPA